MTLTPLPQDPPANQDSPGSLCAAELEAVYREYQPDLAAFLWGVLRDAHLSQDALQQTFRRLAEQGGAVRRETMRGWLFRVAYREALQIRRIERRETQHQQQVWQTQRRDSERSPPEGLIAAEEAARLNQAVSELPMEQQIVVQRRIQQGETFAEIAASQGAPLNTVLTRMRLAVERLRKKLRDE